MILKTISSSAALDGAQTRIFCRFLNRSPTISGTSVLCEESLLKKTEVDANRSGGASRGLCAPRIQGDDAAWFFFT